MHKTNNNLSELFIFNYHFVTFCRKSKNVMSNQIFYVWQ